MNDKDFDSLIDRIEAIERGTLTLSEGQIEELTNRAADKAIERVYTQIGKWTVQRVLFVIGAAVLAFLAWLGTTGKVPLK